ncbi:MAG TPA: hypothetical protein VF698_07295 [Thermoanaerobaculia bacterium]
MIYRYLREAWQAEVARGKGAAYDPETDRSAFGLVMSSVEMEAEHWQRNCRSLYEVENWNTAQLLDNGGALRKPRIALRVLLTTKENLVLEWMPHPDGPRDFKRWSDAWSVQEPENRILMIRGFGHLAGFATPFASGVRGLVQAVHALLERTIGALQVTFDVLLIEHLYLEYDKPLGVDRQLHHWRIRSVKDAEREEEVAKNQRWLDTTCMKLNTTPEQVLTVFAESSGVLSKTVKRLNEAGVKIGLQAAGTLLARIYHDFPELYGSITDKLPPGVTQSQAKVVPIRRNE